MLEVFNRRNTVILALAQVGVIVTGTIAVKTNKEVIESSSLAVMSFFGPWLLLVPLAWITAISYCDRTGSAAKDLRSILIIAGLIILVGLGYVFFYPVFEPWLGIWPESHGLVAPND